MRDLFGTRPYTSVCISHATLDRDAALVHSLAEVQRRMLDRLEAYLNLTIQSSFCSEIVSPFPGRTSGFGTSLREGR